MRGVMEKALLAAGFDPPPAPEPGQTRFGLLVAGLVANGHSKVLVVGVRGGNVTEEHRAHPQIECWDGDEAVTRQIPAAAKLVLVTRFIGHHSYAKLKAECDKRGIVFGGKMMGTGEIREILRPFFEKKAEAKPEPQKEEVRVEHKEKPAAEAAPVALRKFMHGAQRAFIEKHLDLKHAGASSYDEARRLLLLARAEGFTTTVESMAQAIRMARRRMDPTSPARRPRTPPPAPVAHAVPAVASAIAEDDQELMRLLNDAVAAIQLVKDTIAKRSEKHRQLKALLKDL